MVGESTQIELVPSGKIRTAPHSSNVNRQENERSWVFRLCNTPPEIAKTELDSTKADCSSCSISPSTEDHAGASWIYSNPSLTNWSLESRILLNISYRSISQSVPEYTNISKFSDYLHRGLTLSSGGRDEHDDTGPCLGAGGCVCRTCSRGLQRIGLGPRPVEIREEIYTSADILKTEVLEGGVSVRGFASCKCMKVYLRPKNKRKDRLGELLLKNLDEEVAKNILRRQSEWDNHSRTFLGGEPFPDEWANKGGERADDVEGTEPWHNEGENSSSTFPVHGPIIIFAIPTEGRGHVAEDCPPLLWKVFIPPDPTISIEGLTILEGSLEVDTALENRNITSFAADGSSMPSTSSIPVQTSAKTDPTAVFINGYQSWSYAGTVTKGQAQPSSAMPHMLSRAFNRGATVPPTSNSHERRRKDKTSLGGLGDNDSESDDTNPLLSLSADKVYAENDDEFAERHFYKSDFYTCVTSARSIPLVTSSKREPYSEEAFESEGECETILTGPSLVLGFLSQRKQYGLVTLCRDLEDLSLHSSLDCAVPCRSEGVSTDWAYAQIMPDHCYDEDPTDDFITAVAAHNCARPMRHGYLSTGWCSWYHYYENIEESVLRHTFETLGRLNTKIESNVAIIDDGYMTAWGDWGSLKPDAFPSAFEDGRDLSDENVDSCMRGLADSIRSNGMQPGLWLAPFAADFHSKLAKKNPGWIIRDNNGRPANSANCGKFFYGLDATNPEVRRHAFDIIRRATSVWGFECLKLDFLYASCLKGNGKYDLSLSRAEAMDLALRCLRVGAGPSTFIIGCGCPLGTAVGYIDGMRISADTGPSWYPAFPLPWWDNSTLPCLRAMVRNSITRTSMGHRWWHNDPDCILLGETTNLTDEDVVSAATVVGMTGGMMLMSDDLTKLKHKRLRIITRVFPLTGASAVALDLHTPTPEGIPSLLRMWCTDEIATWDRPSNDDEVVRVKHNEEALQTARTVAFRANRELNQFNRIRNRVFVAQGLGSWSVVSLSNWSDQPATRSAPLSVLLPPSKRFSDSEQSSLGYHVLSFWSSKYIWIPLEDVDRQRTLSKRLDPHETEIFHMKPILDRPQYVGSDIHFTCGYEVLSFRAKTGQIDVTFKNYCRRSGYVFLYIPQTHGEIRATVNQKVGEFEVIATIPDGGRVLRVWLTIRGKKKSEHDGRITLEY